VCSLTFFEEFICDCLLCIYVCPLDHGEQRDDGVSDQPLAVRSPERPPDPRHIHARQLSRPARPQCTYHSLIARPSIHGPCKWQALGHSTVFHLFTSSISATSSPHSCHSTSFQLLSHLEFRQNISIPFVHTHSPNSCHLSVPAPAFRLRSSSCRTLNSAKI
jgi:hypothetical protein